MLKQRTGKECKKITCKRYNAYSNWYQNLGGSALGYCIQCKNSHVSQFEKEIEKK